MRRAVRKDLVHKPIVAALEARGFVVIDTSSLGGGAPDVFVYNPPNKQWEPMEFKSGNDVRQKKAGPDGEAISNNRQKKSLGIDFPIVHSLSEALALFGLTEVRS